MPRCIKTLNFPNTWTPTIRRGETLCSKLRNLARKQAVLLKHSSAKVHQAALPSCHLWAASVVLVNAMQTCALIKSNNTSTWSTTCRKILAWRNLSTLLSSCVSLRPCLRFVQIQWCPPLLINQWIFTVGNCKIYAHRNNPWWTITCKWRLSWLEGEQN